jgi:hypothetical protein
LTIIITYAYPRGAIYEIIEKLEDYCDSYLEKNYPEYAFA